MNRIHQPFFILPGGLLYDGNAADVFMLLVLVIRELHHIHIHIFLCRITTVIGFSIPMFVDIVRMEDQVAPSVVNAHLVFLNEIALAIELIVDAIIIR